jgi:4-oxalocrotonate tautomerase
MSSDGTAAVDHRSDGAAADPVRVLSRAESWPHRSRQRITPLRKCDQRLEPDPAVRPAPFREHWSRVSPEAHMPLVQVKLIEGVFTDKQKSEMIRKLTEAMVSIEGENMRSVTWVTIEEVRSGDWGIGGQPLTTAAVKALAEGKPAG